MKIKKICQECQKEYIANSTNSKYCSASCRDRYNYLKNPERMKRWRNNNPERNKENSINHYQKNKEIYIQKSKEWIKNHPEEFKESQRKSSIKYYYKNHKIMKLQNKERSWTQRRRTQIFEIIGTICSCGKKAKEIHHKQYKNLPRKNLKEYCKYLEPLCKKCHWNKHH